MWRACLLLTCRELLSVFLSSKENSSRFFFQNEGQRAWGFLFACFSQMLCNFNEFKDEKAKLLQSKKVFWEDLISCSPCSRIYIFVSWKGLKFVWAVSNVPPIYPIALSSRCVYSHKEKLFSLFHIWAAEEFSLGKFTPESRRQFKGFYVVILMIELFA